MRKRQGTIDRREGAPTPGRSREIAIDAAKADPRWTEWCARNSDVLAELEAADDDFGMMSGETADEFLARDAEPDDDPGRFSDQRALDTWHASSRNAAADAEPVPSGLVVSSDLSDAGPAAAELRGYQDLLWSWGALFVPPKWPRTLLLMVLDYMISDGTRIRTAREIAAWLNRDRAPLPANPEIGFEGDPSPGPIARVALRRTQRLKNMLRLLRDDPPPSPGEEWRRFVLMAANLGVTVEGPFRSPGTADPNAPGKPPILICHDADGREYRYVARRSEKPGETWEPDRPADPCPRCGKAIPRQPGKGRPFLYCSTRCGDAVRKAAYRARPV